MMNVGIDTSAGMPDVRLDQIRFKYIPRKHASLAEKCAGEMRRKTQRNDVGIDTSAGGVRRRWGG